MKPFVTIEGSGRNATTIFGKAVGSDTGVVEAVRASHLRSLKVRSTGAPSNSANAIKASGNRVTLSDVAVEMDAVDTNEALGIRVVGGSVALTDVSVRSSAVNGQSQGIRAESGSSLELMNTWVNNESDNFGNPAGLELRDSKATGFGIFFSSNVFALLGRGTSTFELFDGTLIGGRGTGADFTGSFACVGVADADFTARNADCI